MPTNLPTAKEIARSKAAVRGMLRDIGYVLWLSRKMAAEMNKTGTVQPVQRPDMAEFCAIDMTACAA